VLLVRATHRETRLPWLYYGIGLTLAVLLDVYLLLLLVAHVAFVAACERRHPARLRRFAVTSAVACCVLAPFVIAATHQAHQISWIAPIGRRTIEDVAIQQYFERDPLFALLSALVVATAIVLRRLTFGRTADSDCPLLTLAVAWLVLPTVLVLVASAFIHPVYTPRYLAFTAPGMALIVGICIARVAVRPWAVAALLGLFTAAAVPNYFLAQRGPYAKYGMDYSQVADLITAKASPGDCLLVNDTVTFMPAPMRPLLAARPDAYRKLVDLTLWQRATDRHDVFDTNLIPEVVARPLARCPLVWIITQADPSMPAHEQGVAIPPGPRYGATPAFAVPHDLGFRLVERWQFNLVQVIEAVR
jgi:mannosyltransferase